MSQVPGYTKTGICPYNPAHIILVERMQTHLVKCAKNYPEIFLKKCPFNTVHLLKEVDFESHVTQCPDRVNFDLYQFNIAPGRSTASEIAPVKANPQLSELSTSDDNWDDDDQHQSYNPQAYVENANVIRTLNLAKPSERKAFREAEKLRLQSLNQKKKTM